MFVADGAQARSPQDEASAGRRLEGEPAGREDSQEMAASKQQRAVNGAHASDSAAVHGTWRIRPTPTCDALGSVKYKD